MSFSFSYLAYKNVTNEKMVSVKTIIFHLMTSEARNVDLMSNLIYKRYRDMNKALQRFFIFFLTIKLLEMVAVVCENVYFLKIRPLLSSGDLSIDLPYNDLCKSVRSRRNLSCAVCHLSFSSVVFEI